MWVCGAPSPADRNLQRCCRAIVGLGLMEPIDQDLDPAEIELPTEPMLLNVGPAHPAMHGTVRIVMELSGESIEQIGRAHV